MYKIYPVAALVMGAVLSLTYTCKTYFVTLLD